MICSSFTGATGNNCDPSLCVSTTSCTPITGTLLQKATSSTGDKDYMVFFSGTVVANSCDATACVKIYVGSDPVPATVRCVSLLENSLTLLSTQGYLTNVPSGSNIRAKYKFTACAGTDFKMHDMNHIIIPV